MPLPVTGRDRGLRSRSAKNSGKIRDGVNSGDLHEMSDDLRLRPDGSATSASNKNTDMESVGGTAREIPMAHFVLSDIASAVNIQAGAVVSRVIFRDNQTEVTVFGFAAGEGLTEHQASRTAIVQVMKGRLEFIADGEELNAEPGFWLHMEPGTPHSLTAREPTIMLLTLIDTG
jgi:quercetin dioxygenase-like cupin family protein